MSIESRRHQYGKVFGHWQIKEFLGSGSGGKSAVFRLEHTESIGVESALKVISLIEERGSIDDLSPEYRKEYENARHHCSERAESEVRLMNDLQGNTNIVDYLDHTFVDWSDETGYGRDMLIRMERLSDLRGQIRIGKHFDRADIIKIGQDICTALILCHNRNILHRDIKPENIFINKNNRYKLGDFGISRIVNTTSSAVASTGIGTPQYWAPEQTSGKYDVRVDIYSLGLVLYELSNRNRLPFAESSYVREQDIHRRLLGEKLPVPSNADDALAQVILTACAYRPEDRYQTAEAFLQALNRLDDITDYRTLPAYGDAPQQHYRTMPAQNDYRAPQPSPISTPVQTSSNSRKKALPWLLAVAAILLALFLLFKPDTTDDAGEPTAPEISQTEENTPESEALKEPASETETVHVSETDTATVPVPTDPLAALNVQDTFTFGRYEQDNNFNNGSEAIEWIVLAKQDNCIFVISKYALDCQRYNTQNTDVTWETSSVRNWLNYVFYNDAFTKDEKERILPMTVATEDNAIYGTESGADTTDYVYLPSLEEVESMSSSARERICRATPYAVNQNAYVNSSTGGSWWLLRTAGINSSNVVSVDSDGSIDYDGGAVAADRGTIRPVMWLRVG